MTSQLDQDLRANGETESWSRLAALLETSHELAGKLELHELLEAVAFRAQDLVRSDGVTLYLVEGDILRPFISREEYSDEVLDTPLKLGEGISGGVALRGEAELVNRVDLTGRGFQIPGTPIEPESLLCAPLKHKDEVIGVLTLNRLGEWEFTEADFEFIKGLASLAASAIHSARLYERLANSERNYRTLFNNIGEAIFVHDPETLQILDISESTVHRYGYTREEFLKMTIFDLHPPEDREEIKKRVQEGMKERSVKYSSLRHQTKEGVLLEVNISAVDIEFMGRPARLALAVDVTEQQRVRRELEQAHKLESVGLLASGIAHNLNGPLSGIQGFTELLRATHPELSELDVILKQTNKIKDIIRTLMIRARHQEEIEARPIQLNELLRTELAFLEADLFFKHEIEKVYDFDSNLPEVWGVYGDFSQALLNIINSAIDAMYETPRKTLKVRTRYENGCVIIEIEDSGIGMTEEVKERIFEPFFTTKPSMDSEDSEGRRGTGLGLSGSRELLARYGGRIEVESEPGEGSTFRVILSSDKARSACQENQEHTVA